MVIYPAVDIKDGKCVRLVRGDMERATVYYSDPSQAASVLEREGARFLHVVDLNGAFKGVPCNVSVIKSIVEQANVPVQLGGGIRDLDTLQGILKLGVKRVVLGTAALKDRRFLLEALERYPSRIVVGIDAVDGFVAVEGWKQVSKVKALDFAREMEALGVKRVIFTNVSRDGMLEGPDLYGTRGLIEGTGLEVIASGGIRNIQDLIELKKAGAAGAVVGRALYAGSLSLREAMKALKEESGCLPGE